MIDFHRSQILSKNFQRTFFEGIIISGNRTTVTLHWIKRRSYFMTEQNNTGTSIKNVHALPCANFTGGMQ